MNGMLTDKKVYDRNFASFYNYVLTDQAREYAHYILDYASKKVTEKNIVDYMCGTGNLLKIFEDAGWKTTGIDLSTNMLDVAKLQLKNTNLIQADVTKSIKMKKAALAVSTADAVNHLSSIEDIKLFFNNVYQGLKKDGIFIFDMNTQLGAKVNCSHITTSTKHYIAIREGFFDEINNIGYTRFQGAYQKRGTNYYVRYDSTIYNYIYPISKIVDLLKKVGFKAINLHNEYTSEKYDEEWTERVLFICNK